MGFCSVDAGGGQHWGGGGGNRLDPAVERDDRLDHVGAVVILSSIGRGFRRYGDHFTAD